MLHYMHNFLKICIASLIGLLSAAACYAHKAPVEHAADFMWPYRAAQVLRDGDNPYRVALPDLPYDPDAPLYYPLPAVLMALPFSYLPPVVAGATFIGISAALLAWALQREGRWRLWMFVGAPWWWAIAANHWSLLMTAALLLPVLQGLAVLIAESRHGYYRTSTTLATVVTRRCCVDARVAACVANMALRLVSEPAAQPASRSPVVAAVWSVIAVDGNTMDVATSTIGASIGLFSTTSVGLRSSCTWSCGAFSISAIGAGVT